MRSILEQVVSHLVNEDVEKAEELMHKYMVAKARQIHESLRQGDDEVLAEGWDDEIMSENYFTEADLEDAVVDNGEDIDADAAEGELEADVAADAGAEGDVPEFGGDDAAADMGDDADMGGEDAGVDGDSPVEAVRDDIEAMKAELDDLLADMEAALGGADTGDAAADDLGDEMAPAADADADAVEDDMASDEEVKEGDLSVEIEHLDEEFDDITESIVDELQKISVPNTDGREQGNRSIQQNTTSGKFTKEKAHPIHAKQDEHGTFEREPAPASRDLKKYRNNKPTADAGRARVSKEGDGKAELNDPKLGAKSKSPIAGK